MQRGADCPRVDADGRKVPCGVCDYCQFRRTMSGVFALYPHASANELTFDAYWQELRDFALDVVRVAFQRARDETPGWIPNGPIVKAHCKRLERERALRDRQPAQPRLLLVGDTIELSDSNPARELATRWELEDARAGRAFDAPTPADVARERLAEIGRLLEGIGR